jgi:hypothetical protein
VLFESSSLLDSIEFLLGQGVRKTPLAIASLLSLFKVWKSPAIEIGAFSDRSNKKTDYASEVTNAFCLAPRLLNPTTGVFAAYP